MNHGLTIAMRSCLLKAARTRLAQLHEEYEGLLVQLLMTAQRDVLFSEIACVTAAIAWLWAQPATDDGR